MNTESNRVVLEMALAEKGRLLRAVGRLQLLATALVFSTVLLAFARPQTPTTVFISLFPFLLLQVFATRNYTALVQITRRIKLLAYGPYFSQPAKLRWTIPAGVAVRDTYFLLLLVFDLSWLSHAYLHPSPAATFSQFLRQLAIGPISGTAFLVFTIALWAFYAWLFVIGSLYIHEINSVDNPLNAVERDGSVMEEVWMQVRTCGGDELYLQAGHLPNPDAQPVILFPGFYQNGYVYHLSEQVSLARYLQANGFDVWLVHPRGTALSDGRERRTSLDDFAAEDIPAVVNHVFSKTGRKPVFVGHSQGGISGIVSLMGVVRPDAKTVVFSDAAAEERQGSLKVMVVLGSFLDFSFSKPSWLKNFVQNGICLTAGKRKMRLISSAALLALSKKLSFVGTPFSFSLRLALLQSRKLRLALFPLVVLLNVIALLKLWEFLYHIPNVDRTLRKTLFYKTMDGTFSDILQQFQGAVATGCMRSGDQSLNYSDNYHRVKLPVSVVAMEYDTLADPPMMKQSMFDALGSEQKFYTLWKGVGHEDHFTDPRYFPQVLEAIKLVG